MVLCDYLVKRISLINAFYIDVYRDIVLLLIG